MKRAIQFLPLTILIQFLNLLPLANAQFALYDNLDGPSQASGEIGLKFDDRTEPLAQQFKTGPFDNVSSVSLQLQRTGSPTGEVAVEIWDDAGEGVPANRVATIGAFDVASLSALAPQLVTLENTVSGLSTYADYYVVLNNLGTNINFNNSYRFGVVGNVAEAQDEGTNGASLLLGSTTMGASWAPINDLFGCHPSGACGSYLRMSVQAVPEPSSFSIAAFAGLFAWQYPRRRRSAIGRRI